MPLRAYGRPVILNTLVSLRKGLCYVTRSYFMTVCMSLLSGARVLGIRSHARLFCGDAVNPGRRGADRDTRRAGQNISGSGAVVYTTYQVKPSEPDPEMDVRAHCLFVCQPVPLPFPTQAHKTYQVKPSEPDPEVALMEVRTHGLFVFQPMPLPFPTQVYMKYQVKPSEPDPDMDVRTRCLMNGSAFAVNSTVMLQ